MIAAAALLLPSRTQIEPVAPRPTGRRQRRSRGARLGLLGRSHPRMDELHPYSWVVRRGIFEPRWVRAFRWLVWAIFWLAMIATLSSKRIPEVQFIIAMVCAMVLHLLTKFAYLLETTRQLHEDSRSGALELLLCTPLSAAAMLRGIADTYRRAFRRRFLAVTLSNLVMIVAVTVFHRQLKMNRGSIIFVTFFLGGAAHTWLDFSLMRWTGMFHALVARSHLRAVMRTLLSTTLIPWILFGFTFALVTGTNDVEGVAFGFALYYAITAAIGGWNLAAAKRNLRTRFRRLAAGELRWRHRAGRSASAEWG
jgi:uncharacterized membrane protein YhaH (DUF805 family)